MHAIKHVFHVCGIQFDIKTMLVGENEHESIMTCTCTYLIYVLLLVKLYIMTHIRRSLLPGAHPLLMKKFSRVVKVTI